MNSHLLFLSTIAAGWVAALGLLWLCLRDMKLAWRQVGELMKRRARRRAP